MSDNVIIPCPHCGEQCAIAPAHMSRLLACPHCAREFVPGGGGGGGGGMQPPPRRESGRGAPPRARGGNNNQSLLVIGGVVVLLVLFVGFMASSGGSSRKKRTRSRSGNSVRVAPEVMPGASPARAGGGVSSGPMVHPDESISLQTAESGSYRVNGNVHDTLMSVRVWKDPHALSRGKKAGRIAHDDTIEVLGKATNKNGVLVYKVRGKYKGGSSTCEGYVSAFYIEKDYKVIAEHQWDWMDHDELQRRGKE